MSIAAIDPEMHESDNPYCPCARCGQARAITDQITADRPRPPVLPRVEVAAFAQAMEHQLRAHDDRPGWKRDDPTALYFHLLEEVIELGYALGLPTHLLSSGFFARLRLCDGQGPGTIGAEAADVGNMAMMIADVCDALEGGDATRRG